MTANQFRAVCEFEAGLTVSAPVDIRWRNKGASYRGTGTAAKIHGKSFRVKLANEVASQIGFGSYPAGYLVWAPQLDNLREWSPAARVEPVGGYVAVE
jgi:hypothetical protein